MDNTLKEIIKNKGEEITQSRSNKDLFQKIFEKKTASIIGEVKIASPSYDYSELIEYTEIIDAYLEATNIKAISILIDKKFFKWDITRIKYLKEKWNKPTLFKEFIMSTSQIDWASYYWYDSVLLMKKTLAPSKLESFTKYSFDKNIFPIIEVDNKEDLETVLQLQNQEFWIAINARNFDTMKVDTSIHSEIYKAYEKELRNRLLFAFSGIKPNKVTEEYSWKYNWVLLGRSLVEEIIEK